MARTYLAAGENLYYDLGLGDATKRTSHAQIAGDWKLIVSSSADTFKFAIGIKADGTLWGVGDNTYKQLGGLPNASYTTWTQIGIDNDWADVAVGEQHIVVLKASGFAYACGSNSFGQCGVGTTTQVDVLTAVSGGHTFKRVHASIKRTFGIKTDDTLLAWGENGTYGQLGLGTTTSYYTTPQAVTLPAAVAQIAVGYNFSYALLADGRLYAWGVGGSGQLGNGSTATRLSPYQAGSLTTWAFIAAGLSAAYAIKTDGTAWSTGGGAYYATAQPFTTNLSSFTQIGTATDWAAAAGGFYCAMLLKTSGAVHVVGYNDSGLLGTGSIANVTALADLEAVYGAVFPSGDRTASMVINASHLSFELPPEVITAPTSLTVVYPAEPPITAPTRLAITSTGTLIAPTALAVIAPGHIANWTARCLIDGVDVSASLEGVISVTADEGAARIASLAINPPSGTIAPLDYVGRDITLDYVPVIGGTPVPLRLFTGRIDTPQYDLHARLLNLSCVDDLQNRVASLDRSVIDSLIGGRYCVAVQGEILDNWDYAEARLTTVAGSLDADAHGGMRVTPWELSTSWATYGAGDLLYEQSVIGSLPQRSTLVNSVSIEFEYRYPRLRQRYTTVGWSGTHIDMAPCGWSYPKQQDIMGAASGSGWWVTQAIFSPAPTAIPHSSGGLIYPDDGSIDMAVLRMTQRHSQSVTEAYTLLVSAPESVTANGELPHTLNGALESSFDGNAWESAPDVVPLLPSGGEMDYSPDATRADSDYAIHTLLDQALVKILGSHRGARLTNAVLCNPDLDVDKRVTIATADMDVSGKVVSVNHVLNLLTGSATSEFSIGCFGAGGAGIITPDTLDPPSPPDEASETQDWSGSIPPLSVNTFGVTPYTDALMGLLLDPPETILVENVPPDLVAQSFPNPFYVAGAYPVTGFRVQMPGVDDDDRNPVSKPVSGSYQVLIPADTMTFTIP